MSAYCHEDEQRGKSRAYWVKSVTGISAEAASLGGTQAFVMLEKVDAIRHI